MDKKKKMNVLNTLAAGLLLSVTLSVDAQNISKIQFCDKWYEYEVGKDSISLYFNVADKYDNRVSDVTPEELKDYLVIKEDGNLIREDRGNIRKVRGGRRIPSEYTFSVLVDLGIPASGKEQIYDAVSRLVESAPDSCVYLSFFGDDVTSSVVVDKDNYEDFREDFFEQSDRKVFYSALYSKLVEFGGGDTELDGSVMTHPGYLKNGEISRRALINEDKNILFVFTEGLRRPEIEDISFRNVVEYQASENHIVPKVMAFYYTEEGEEPGIRNTLEGVCRPRRDGGSVIEEREGRYEASRDMDHVMKTFEEVVSDVMYDYAFTYKVDDDRVYSGNVTYVAEWKGVPVGTGEFAIGTQERVWPLRQEDSIGTIVKYLSALLITLLTIAFFYLISKVLVPFFRSKAFAAKYYNKYVPEPNVSRRICHYCKQDIQPGQMVVTRCRHIMHVACWQQNGYKCAEYGQNCKTGIQSHIEWKDMFSLRTLKDCYQVISGIIAGFVSWILFELFGYGLFGRVSEWVVSTFYGRQDGLFYDCVEKTSAFLMMGLLLGFFLSFTFRDIDEYRKKDWKIWLKIIGLSLLTGVIGMFAFGTGAVILCLLMSSMDIMYFPWYCSLPAYILFSISVSLALSIMSTIPVRSALIGGLCSSVIGFAVLYFTGLGKGTSGWVRILLDFIIYGGGLGASLVTVRSLAERYFLVIQNGVRAGQRIPIHKWMNATGGGKKVSIGMTGECEIQMNWEKSNKVAKEHAQLSVDYEKQVPVLKPLALGVVFNTRAELPVGKPAVLVNGDTFKIGDTIFQYVETE